MGIKPEPPLYYLNSSELAIVLKGEVDDADVHAIFAHRKPLEFWGCPPLLVSKIVEAFNALQTEPTYLDVTIAALDGVGTTRPWEVWPQVYATHLPCSACTKVEKVGGRSIPRLKCMYPGREYPVGTVAVAVEKFHVSSKSFRKQLTVELRYGFQEGLFETKRELSTCIHKITIRLNNEACSSRGRLAITANRSSATLLLLPEYASEVFGFLVRARIGSSLVASRALHNLLYQLRQRLPLHHLMCSFQKESMDFGPFHAPYWLEIRHFRRDVSFTGVRCFKIPSATGAENDCALIRHYFSNSHVAVFEAPRADFPFAIKMLADLASRNFSVGRVDLHAEAHRLTDYRSLNAAFGEMRMRELYLSCEEHRFVELIKTTDFFRMSTVQRLRKLNLEMSEPHNEPEEPRCHAGSESPLWVSGIRLLRNCEYYRVDYWTDRHLRSIEREMVQICEAFERGEITDTVEHFQLNIEKEMNYAFSRDNLVVSGMEIEGMMDTGRINNFLWDVYRFRNSSTSQYLTACVGRDKSVVWTRSILHILKGEVFPDASFMR